MKTKHLLSALVLMVMTCCGKETTKTTPDPKESDYIGTVTVIYNESPFDNEDIRVNFSPAEDGQTASITIHQIRFVPQMTATIDVTIPGIIIKKSSGKIVLYCERCIPLAMGGEFPKYTVTDLNGVIAGNELSFSLNFGDYPTSFTGRTPEANN